MSYMNIGRRIKQARLAQRPKMTQQQLADAVHVSRPAVTQWETGETKTLEGENLVQVALALGVTVEWLLYGTGPGPFELRPPRSAHRVKVAANDTVVEVSVEVLRLVQSMQALPSKDRATLQALVDALTQPKVGQDNQVG